MTRCIDPDTMVAITALAGDPLPTLDHVAACDACRTRISEAVLLRSELTAEHPVRDGFAQAVVAELSASGAAAGVRRATPSSASAATAWTAVNGLLGAGLGVFVAASGSAVAPGTGSSLVVAAALAATAALALPRLLDRVSAG